MSSSKRSAADCPNPTSKRWRARRPRPPWFILEYLSAESWVEGAHGLASPHPRLPLPRRFWFPGFTAKTGGLIRERGLLAARDAFRRDDAAQRRCGPRSEFRRRRPEKSASRSSAIRIRCCPRLLDAWSDGDDAVVCLVPDGVATGALDAWTAGNVPHPGHPLRRGRLTLHTIPFVPQDDLRSAALVVGASISFAARTRSSARSGRRAPAYGTSILSREGAHWPKLDAFLARYTAGLDAGSAGGAAPLLAGVERRAGCRPDRQRLERVRRRRARRSTGMPSAGATELAALPDLAAGLVKAARHRV